MLKTFLQIQNNKYRTNKLYKNILICPCWTAALQHIVWVRCEELLGGYGVGILVVVATKRTSLYTANTDLQEYGRVRFIGARIAVNPGPKTRRL